MAFSRTDLLHSRVAVWYLYLAVLIVLVATWSWRDNQPRPVLDTHPVFAVNVSSWEFDHHRDARNHGLTDSQCDKAFPGLGDQLERAKAWHQEHKPGGVISESDIDLWDERGQVRVMIQNGELYVLDGYGLEHFPPHIPDRPFATLSSIHQALVSAPDPRTIPNVEFTFEFTDNSDSGGPKRTIWSYCRPVEEEGVWLIPAFGFYAFPGAAIGSYDEFRANVFHTEESNGFKDKKAKLIWRGAAEGHAIRQELIKHAKNKYWSEVSAVNWRTKENVIDQVECCRYQYSAHTEGVTWSGRLDYLLNCGSVVLYHPLKYFAYYYHLFNSNSQDPKQNVVPLRANFSNLEDEMRYFLKHPKEAQTIADNARDHFRDRYLTPAAVSCYWRKMFRVWREVQGWEPRIWEDRPKRPSAPRYRGVSWERYLIMSQVGAFTKGKNVNKDKECEEAMRRVDELEGEKANWEESESESDSRAKRSAG